jgi:zinc transport system substrate-binding protein
MQPAKHTPGRVALAAALAVALVLFATGAAGATAPSAAKRTDVVAAFYPLAFAASAVGGRYVDVSNLTPPGVEPHDLELTPDEVDALQDAGLVVVMGKGFQPAVEQVAGERERGTLEVLRRLPIDSTGKRVASDGEANGRALDPHVWLDPVLMSKVVGEVRGALAKADPTHATAFDANAAKLQARLAVLDAEYRAGLATCQRDLIVTSHEAFGYVARRYGLRQEGVSGLAPDAEPSAKRLGELSDLAERQGLTTIFTEELLSPKVAETLAREAGGLRVAVLNPLEGLTDREVHRGDDYFAVMRANLRKIQHALGCTT